MTIETPETKSERPKGVCWSSVGEAIFDGEGKAVGAVRTPEDARRIAACVNACYGMPSEALEAWTVGSIQDPVNDLLAELESILVVESRADERRRHGDRRRSDRRHAVSEVRVNGE